MNNYIVVFDNIICGMSPDFFNIFYSVKKENNFSTIKDVIKFIRKKRLIVKNHKNKKLWVELNLFALISGLRGNKHVKPFDYIYYDSIETEKFLNDVCARNPELFKNEYLVMVNDEVFTQFKNNMREIDTDGSYFCHVKNNSKCDLYGRLRFYGASSWWSLTTHDFIRSCYLFEDVMSEEEKEYFNEMKCSVDNFIKSYTSKLYILKEKNNGKN